MDDSPSNTQGPVRQTRREWITRRRFIAKLSVSTAAAVLPGNLTSLWAAIPALPNASVNLNIIDVAGNLRLTQPSIENYRKANPKLVDKIHYTQAPAPELPGKIKAQQNAGRLDIDLVLTGLDGLAAGIDQDLWLRLMPDYEEKFPNLESSYSDPARDLYELGKGYGITVTYYPSGPLLEYAPERVKDPPGSTDELLSWCKAYPGRFMYARPANSGPGRTFLMGLPYLLGDTNPKDPVTGWANTWSYLKELNKYIDYYPSGTTATMKEFGEGSRDMIASTTGWDINPRVLGIVPKSAQIAVLKGFHWVTDGHYMVIPKGIAPEKVAVPITLGTVLIAEGLLTYLGPQGWLNRFLLMLHFSTSPVHLTHNYWGVLLSLVVSGFPFAYLLLLSYLTGIDPALPQAAATLGASPWRQFIHIYLALLIPGLAIAFCLSFVQAFSVFPSAVLLGAPAGPTRVISIAAYQAAFEDYDYPMASAIAMVMAGVQLLIVALVLATRNLFYRGPTSGGKG